MFGLGLIKSPTMLLANAKLLRFSITSQTSSRSAADKLATSLEKSGAGGSRGQGQLWIIIETQCWQRRLPLTGLLSLLNSLLDFPTWWLELLSSGILSSNNTG